VWTVRDQWKHEKRGAPVSTCVLWLGVCVSKNPRRDSANAYSHDPRRQLHIVRACRAKRPLLGTRFTRFTRVAVCQTSRCKSVHPRSPTTTNCTCLRRFHTYLLLYSSNFVRDSNSEINRAAATLESRDTSCACKGIMRSSAFSTCWDEQRLPWKSQAVHSSMLHRMVQPAYLTFRQQCRQAPASDSSSSRSSSSSRNSSNKSTAAGVAAQHIRSELEQAKLQRLAAPAVCDVHAFRAAQSSSCCSASQSNSTEAVHSMQATLRGPVTSSSSSSSSSSAARPPGGSPGPPKPGKDSDEFGPNFGGKLAVPVLALSSCDRC
jgi:hypothetical protein